MPRVFHLSWCLAQCPFCNELPVSPQPTPELELYEGRAPCPVHHSVPGDLEHSSELNSVPQIHVYLEAQDVTVFGSRVFADVISEGS